MDMWQPYREAVRQCPPDAVIVIDKFHAVKMANEAIERVRKSVRAGLDDKQRRTLMHDRFLLLRRRSELSEKDTLILEIWTKNFPALGQAYELKELFYQIWDAETKDEAYQRYVTWQESITPDIADAFLPITLTVEQWGDELFAYFDHRVTNAYTESLNGLVQIIWNTPQNLGILEPDREELAGDTPIALSRKYSFEAFRANLLYATEAMHVYREIEQHPLNFGVGIAALTRKIAWGHS